MSKLKPLKPAERVAVLRDAISQLKKKVYEANQGCFIGSQMIDLMEHKKHIAVDLLGLQKTREFQFKDVLPSVLNEVSVCEVCAKGAIVISAIAKFNNYSLAEVDKLDDKASTNARILFGKENADKMENYFEGWKAKEEVRSKKDGFLLEAWEDLYEDPHQRLIEIFKNALDNKGIFKPENNTKAVKLAKTKQAEWAELRKPVN